MGAKRGAEEVAMQVQLIDKAALSSLSGTSPNAEGVQLPRDFRCSGTLLLKRCGPSIGTESRARRPSRPPPQFLFSLGGYLRLAITLYLPYDNTFKSVHFSSYQAFPFPKRACCVKRTSNRHRACVFIKIGHSVPSFPLVVKGVPALVTTMSR